ncbi:putative PEP-binding protein [Pseudomonas brassicacearum]|uniref:putative PEP-binding protein n=1 Tax=Pseudomonas brassicacearum TaxID=930166 RepID=UPI001E0CDB20|nr:putative PEP-binding protein [Pseudomonas brassicacearum]CAH0305819.1 Phosphoenolpyruvate-dependent phosphotransferase system [Pseudomonas brassicacearum]
MNFRLSLSGELPTPSVAAFFSGVGLLRSEFVLRRHGAGLQQHSVQEALTQYVIAVCELFQGKPVWYRLADLWADEAATLATEKTYIVEQNPMLGIRGLRRARVDQEAFRIELGILGALAARFDNLHIIFPFIQDRTEFDYFASALKKMQWPNRYGTMLEVPSALLEVEHFISSGASNLVFGLNDLSCLTLGQDRGADDIKLHPALWRLINQAIADISGRCEYGVAGKFSAKILEKVSKEKVDYISLHYGQLPELLDNPAFLEMEDVNLVSQIKRQTNLAKRALKRET